VLPLGWSEKGPSFQIRPRYSDVYVDLGGQNVPFDVMYQGEDALVSITLAKFNQTTLNIIQNKANPGGGPPGTDPFGSIGTLMLTEQKAYNLFLRFPYASVKAFYYGAGNASGPMPPGYRFLQATFVTDDHPALGTKPKFPRVAWHCLRNFDPSTGTFKLFDFDMSAIGSINPGI